MIEEMAVNYFRSLSSAEKKRVIRGILASLTEKEKVEIAKMLLKEN